MSEKIAKAGEPEIWSLPTSGRLVGIDFGTVRIGLATCDPSQVWVTPFDTYFCRNTRLDAQYFRDFVAKEQIVGLVIGLPVHCSGDESQKSAEARRFSNWLLEVVRLPYELFDERFTTSQARDLLRESGLTAAKKKKNLDRLAAYLILSNFLESRKCQFQSEKIDGLELETSGLSQIEPLDDARRDGP